MSLKGVTLDQLPEKVRRALKTPEDRAAFLVRWAIVAYDLNGVPLVQEELLPALLKTVSPKARRLAGFFFAADPYVRREVLGLLQADGSPKFPWS